MVDPDERERRIRIAYAVAAWVVLIFAAAGLLAVVWVILVAFLGLA